MAREYYTLALNGDISSLRRELARILDSISRRLNSISQSGGNISLGGKKLVNVAAGEAIDDAIRLDQAFLLADLAARILGTVNRITVTDNSDNTITINLSEVGINHNLLANLTVGDVHTQYLFLAGRTGGQTVAGDIKGPIRAKQYFFAGF